MRVVDAQWWHRERRRIAVGAQPVEGDPQVAPIQLAGVTAVCGLVPVLSNCRDTAECHLNEDEVGSRDVCSELPGVAGARRDLVHQWGQTVAGLVVTDVAGVASGKNLRHSAVTRLHCRGPLQEEDEAVPGVRFSEGAAKHTLHLLVLPLQDCVNQLILVGKAPVGRADPKPGVTGDIVEGCAEAAFGE